MGFGNGYSRKSDNGGKRYNNEMTAHVWNAGSVSSGQSSNGNLFFRGATIYSYGTHFAIAHRMPDGTVFVNEDSYSVSTSGHQSDVRRAIRDRRTVSVAGLTDMCGLLEMVTDKGDNRDRIRKALASRAVALESMIYAPGTDHYIWNEETKKTETVAGELQAGAYLAALAGLPAASWPKIQRDAAKERAKVASAAEKLARDQAEARALRLADMPNRKFREQLEYAGTSHNDEKLKAHGTELRRARKLMLATKRGPLAAKTRLETIRERIKIVDAKVASYDSMYKARNRRLSLSVHLSNIRNWRDARDKSPMYNANAMLNLARDGDYLATFGRTSALREAGNRLSEMANAGASAIMAENTRLREVARINEAKEQAERVALWLAGEPVGRIRFDAPNGGAALRIIGDELQTSHGAFVPLAHAVKVFRFVKMCRDKGEGWKRNGKTIRVGHFQVDSIAPTGDFVAGCHSIGWPEVERVAKLAGVFECAPSAEALETSHA